MEIVRKQLSQVLSYLEHSIDRIDKPSEIIIAAVDVGIVPKTGTPSDIGITYLDLVALAEGTSARRQPSKDALSIHHYCFARKERQQRRAKRGFKFGEIERIPIADDKEKGQALSSLLRQLGTDGARPVILVGHDLQNDLRSFARAGFDPSEAMSILAYIDTQEVVRALFGRQMSLSDLCWRLDIRVGRFHISGNDAAYTMLVVLKMLGMVCKADRAAAYLDSIIEKTLTPTTTVRDKPNGDQRLDFDLADVCWWSESP